MLINLSNHPLSTWGEEQKCIGLSQYGDITDYPFPAIDPNSDTESISQLAGSIVADFANKYKKNETVFHIMGEMTLTFQLVTLLKAAGFRCVASTSERIVSYAPDGTKNVVFNFVRFREY